MELPIRHFSPAEIGKTIRENINAKKCPGYDLITGLILKKLPKKGLVFLTNLFNAIIRLSHIPSQWKVAQIVMIPKPGKPPNSVTSYRPISLLPIMAKLFEKLLLKRMKNTITAQGTIPAHQFGFRPQHSTVEQVNRVYNVIANALEEKQYCSAVFLDIEQAFDKVWHAGLLYKIKTSLPQFYLLLKSYLHNRKFQVRYGMEYSELFPINSGVPQGSVLGPVLYTLFTSDLPEGQHTTTATFADDTAILSVHKDPDTASRTLQNELMNIENWLKRWKIKASVAKSVHITFTMKKGNCPTVKLNDELLPRVEEVKYLGMTLDRRLTWASHIKKKRKELDLKMKKMYWLIGKKSKLSLHNKLMVYKTVLKPIWTYGIQLWGTASNSNIEILQRFQSKTLRAIANAPWYISNATLHNDLRIATVRNTAKNHSISYEARIEQHPNQLATQLLDRNRVARRLKKYKPLDLRQRFDD